MTPRITPLKSERIQATLPPGWTAGSGRLHRRWLLPDPRSAARWAGFLASLAEELGSRPRIRIEGESVDLALSGLSAADRALLGALAAL